MEKSMDSSGVAPRNYVDQEETSTFVERESKPIEWTNEKHSLFLNSMESTFVKQLYESLGSLGWNSHSNEQSESKSSKPKQSNIRVRSGKFKATRDDGPRTNTNFRRDEPEVVEEEESGAPSAKPSIQQYRSHERRAMRKSGQYPAHNFLLCRQDSSGGNTEASGQNFNDEDIEEKKSSRLHKKKNKNLIC